jgi:hypothetical protein
MVKVEIPPGYLLGIIAGLEQLSANGLCYLIPTYGINNDVRAGTGVSYES